MAAGDPYVQVRGSGGVPPWGGGGAREVVLTLRGCRETWKGFSLCSLGGTPLPVGLGCLLQTWGGGGGLVAPLGAQHPMWLQVLWFGCPPGSPPRVWWHLVGRLVVDYLWAAHPT